MFIIIEKTGNFNLQRGDLETEVCSKARYDEIIGETGKLLFIDDPEEQAAAEAILFKSQSYYNLELKNETGEVVATGRQVIPQYDSEGKFTSYV